MDYIRDDEFIQINKNCISVVFNVATFNLKNAQLKSVVQMDKEELDNVLKCGRYIPTDVKLELIDA